MIAGLVRLLPKVMSVKDVEEPNTIRLLLLSTKTAHGRQQEAMGSMVISLRHLESMLIMEKKGFVCEADLPQHYWEDLTEKSKEKKFAQSKLVDTYKEKLDAGKTKEEAVAETFTAQDAISGKLDETFNESLL